jgi:YHS domain-containing protein
LDCRLHFGVPIGGNGLVRLVNSFVCIGLFNLFAGLAFSPAKFRIMKTLPFRARAAALGAVLCLAGACKPTSPPSGMAPAMDHQSMANMTMAAAAKPAAAPLVFTAYKPYPYPFSTCIVCGMKLDDQAITLIQGDYEVKVCGKDDEEVFKKNPDQYLAKIKQAYQDAKPNPLKTCVVCGMDLDASALPFVYDGRQFQVCDKDELADFEKDPAKYVKIWDDAAKALADSKK